MDKLSFSGTITSVQPRIRLTRSFDESTHAYLGYVVRLSGVIEAEEHFFAIGIGKASQLTWSLRVGDVISGLCLPVPDPDLDPVEYYKVSKLDRKIEGMVGHSGPPWHSVCPPLEVYRARGHRRLSAITYEKSCISCMWAARMAVEIIIDNWNPRSRMKYRSETFCYGPLSCPLYKAGPTRKVEGRSKMVYEEEDWVDEMNTSHRADDE